MNHLFIGIVIVFRGYALRDKNVIVRESIGAPSLSCQRKTVYPMARFSMGYGAGV